MKVIRKRIAYKSRSDEFRIIPLGDIHLGAAACDEQRLIDTVEYIRKNKYYWIGMGDYCDFINRRDPRFQQSAQAEWLWGISDLAATQRDKFLEIVRPIAKSCLALVEGNHETAILKHTERHIFGEIVTGVKSAAGIKAEETLGVGYYGWLQLLFSRKGREQSVLLNVNLHHGFVGGKLAGAKALNMQRWLWSHNADLVIFGHSHNTSTQPEAVEEIDRAGNVRTLTRKGCYAGTFLRTIGEGHTTYAEIKGYFPLPMDGVEVLLRPGAEHHKDRIRLLS